MQDLGPGGDRARGGDTENSANDLKPESSMTNTPLWDSIEHLDICLAFEKRFRTSLDVGAISTATNIRALAAIVPDTSGV